MFVIFISPLKTLEFDTQDTKKSILNPSLTNIESLKLHTEADVLHDNVLDKKQTTIRYFRLPYVQLKNTLGIRSDICGSSRQPIDVYLIVQWTAPQ